MILRARDGGGGREKSALLVVLRPCVDSCLRFVGGDAGWYDESEPLLDGVVATEVVSAVSATAGGGRLKGGERLGACVFPCMSVEAAGVGGRIGLGIVIKFE